MRKSKFYTYRYKNDFPTATVLSVGSISVPFTEDDVWVWLYRRETAVKSYSVLFKDACESGKLVPATAEELRTVGIDPRDPDMYFKKYWKDTTAPELSIVTKDFDFPTLVAELVEEDYTELQTLSGTKDPILFINLGSTRVEILTKLKDE